MYHTSTSTPLSTQLSTLNITDPMQISGIQKILNDATGGISTNSVGGVGGIADAKVDIPQTEFLGKIGGIEGLGSILEGIASLGQIWAAIQGVNVAKDTLSFNKEAWETNLANQTQSYNTSLEDRIRSRSVTEGWEDGAVDDYLAQHSL